MCVYIIDQHYILIKIYIFNFSSKIKSFLASDKEELIIDKCNAFMRRLVYQEARIRWPDEVRVESKIENTWHCLSIQRAGTKEEEEKKDIEKHDKEKSEIKEAIGLSSLFKKIVESVSIIEIIIVMYVLKKEGKSRLTKGCSVVMMMILLFLHNLGFV